MKDVKRNFLSVETEVRWMQVCEYFLRILANNPVGFKYFNSNSHTQYVSYSLHWNVLKNTAKNVYKIPSNNHQKSWQSRKIAYEINLPSKSDRKSPMKSSKNVQESAH